jgi:hypothetical protein
MPKNHLATGLAALLVAAAMACAAADDVSGNLAHVRAIAQREAAGGDKQAQAYLDALAGTGGARSREEASKWIAGAARRGIPEAQYQVAVMYEYQAEKDPGRAPEIYGKAAEIYRKAAEQGYAPAQIQLAALYAKGQGVALDNAKAMEWATKAAVAGNAEAQGWIGAKYFEGKIVAKNPAKAIEWLEKAAMQGHVIATLLLASMYQNGKDVPADPAKAKYWLERAAGKPDPAAPRHLR